MATSVVDAGPGSRVEFRGVTVGPCPRCGGTGRVPDGIYEFASRAFSRLASRPTPDLQRLLEILQRFESGLATPDEVREEVDEQVPAASSLIAKMLSAEGAATAAWLAVLLMIVLDLLGRGSGPDHAHQAEVNVDQRTDLDVSVEVDVVQDLSDDEVARIVDEVLERQRLTSKAETHAAMERMQKVGRNAPCPCGSGQKHKRCHGKPG